MFNIKDFNLDGDFSLLENDNNLIYLAVLGSRSILNYTKEVLDEFFTRISHYTNIVIVSGGMFGVDIFAHNLALKHGLGTIVFLPCGTKEYKSSMLFKNLKINQASKILFISKYSEYSKARKYTYLERNKLIVDFSKVVFIAQAGLKSGSMYSGNYSLKTKKCTYCVPFSLENKQFIGTNLLISKGANIYLNCENLLNDLGIRDVKKVELNYLISFLPNNFDILTKCLKEYLPQEIEKSLLEGILKGDIFLEEGTFYKK